ncbi:MAG: type II toxin-antitoxin system RelE/ParE family toxin [Gammaproteobacteria bacterium]|nr:type II toxin-antitoxin system RelE/ParE family toxin [Gammaproteobacteria bacterium]
MIKSIKHKGLSLFFETGHTSGIQNSHTKKLQMQLAALNTAAAIEDMNIPGYRLHKLKGSKKTYWSIRVDKNWRLTFEFMNDDVHLLNYEDYH